MTGSAEPHRARPTHSPDHPTPHEDGAAADAEPESERAVLDAGQLQPEARPTAPNARSAVAAVVAIPASIAVALRSTLGAISDTWRDPATRGISFVAFGLLLVGTVFFSLVEGWGPLDSLYYAVISLTTVGYGDYTPQTTLGKIGAIIFILTGIGIIAVFVTNVASKARQRSQDRLSQLDANTRRRGRHAGHSAQSRRPHQAEPPDEPSSDHGSTA